MMSSNFLEQQIAILRKQVGDGPSVEEVCRKAGMTFPRLSGHRVSSLFAQLVRREIPKSRVDALPIVVALNVAQ